MIKNYEKLSIWKEPVAVFLRGAKETTDARKETKKRVLAAVYRLRPQAESDRPSNQTVSIQPLKEVDN